MEYSAMTQQDPMTKTCIDTIRCLAMDAVQAANSGHPGTPMAMAPVTYELWNNYLRFRSERSNLAQSRPLCPVGRARVDAALFDASPDRRESRQWKI